LSPVLVYTTAVHHLLKGCDAPCRQARGCSGYSSTGYSFSSLMRAFSVVKRHRTLASSRLRSASPGDPPLTTSSLLSIRRSKHCPESTLSSVSAMFSQLPCLGVGWNSSRSHGRLAAGAANASYSAPPACG